MGRIVRKCVRRINRFMTKHRVGLFFFVSIFLVISGTLGFISQFLDPKDVRGCCDFCSQVITFLEEKKVISYLWAFLSTILASLIFLQLEDYKMVDSHEDFLDLLIDKIQTVDRELVIVTPNLNLGQVSLPDKFRAYENALRERKKGKVCFYIACSDIEEYHYDQISVDGQGRISCNPSCDHLSYVHNLFLKSLGSSRNNGGVNRVLRDYCFDYNIFVAMLQDRSGLDLIEVHRIKNLFEYSGGTPGNEQVDKNIFLLYDEKKLQVYKIDDRGLCERIVETDHPEVVGRLVSFHTARKPSIDIASIPGECWFG